VTSLSNSYARSKPLLQLVIAAFQRCDGGLHQDMDYKMEPKVGTKAHVKMPTNETPIAPTYGCYAWINED